MSRLLAIGDVHGHSSALENLLQFTRIGGSDTVVTLGDLVNRGPDTRRVIELLLHLRERVNLISLLGNHEIMMLQARESQEARKFWVECGGDMTLKSYGVSSPEKIPQPHWNFLKSCRRFHEEGNFIFVHANLDPSLPLEDQSDGDLFWSHLEYAPWHASGKMMICGHTPQRSGVPANLGRAICIDSDVNNTGWLTCLEPQTGRYWQASDDGQTRMAFLEPEDESH